MNKLLKKGADIFKYLPVFLLFLITASYSQEPTIQKVYGDDSQTNRVNIVFLSEGYTGEQLSQYIIDVENSLDYMFTNAPFSSYQDFFHGYAISVASNESGTDIVPEGIYKDTYFNSGFTTERLLWLKDWEGQNRVTELLTQHMPGYDMVIVLINTDRYGGGGGSYITASLNEQSGNLILHELGHGYAGLADEYDYDMSLSPREAINATAETARENIKWNFWIGQDTPLPTPETDEWANSVGLFEGAVYRPDGWYRPQLRCMMNWLEDPYCAVCRETIIKTIYESVSPIESWYPDNEETLSFTGEAGEILSISKLQTNDTTITTSWSVNGVQEDADGDTLYFSGLDRESGSYLVRAIVSDTTKHVRNPDYAGYLCDTLKWNVEYEQQVKTRNLFHENSGSFQIISLSDKLVYYLPEKADVTFRIYDQSGKTLLRKIENSVKQGNNTLYPGNSFSTLSSGIYIIQLSTSKGGLAVNKFCIYR